MSGDERRISDDRLELMRSAIEAYSSDEVQGGQAAHRAAVRDAVLAGSGELSRLADLFNALAASTGSGES